MKQTTRFPGLENERDWLNRAKAGENAAFDELLGHYRNYLSRYMMSLIRDRDAVDDIIQDTYIKVYKSIGQFRDESSFRSWLCTIARNTWKNYLRKEQFARFDYSFDVYSQDIACDGSVEQDVIKQQETNHLQSAIECLSNKQQQTVRMRIVEQMRFGEIAQRMQCSLSTAKTNHYHGMKSIQLMLAA